MLVQDALVPARFMLTMGHFLAIVMVGYTKESNVEASAGLEPTNAELDDIRTSLDWAWYLSFFAVMASLLGLLTGVSLFFNRVNFLNCMCHFLGGCLVSWFSYYEWHHERLWQIFVLCSLPPLVAELGVLYAVFRRKVYNWSS